MFVYITHFILEFNIWEGGGIKMLHIPIKKYISFILLKLTTQYITITCMKQ